jgi:hypothetical protein
MCETIEDKQSLGFYVPREDGGSNCLIFEVQPNGNVWVDMSGGGGVGPDTWDVEIEEFSELTPENMLRLAAWLTAKATPPSTDIQK